MRLSDIQRRLQAPFSAHLVGWRAAAFNKDRSRAMLLAYIDARAVQDRLDAICPDGWSYELSVVEGAATPTVKGRLTVLGVTREEIGEAGEGEFGTLKAAASDALKRCAVQFGIGRYLYDLPRQWVDWNNQKREPKTTPQLPEWARPDFERSPGGAHIAQAMDQLRYELPVDLDLQREVYKHLKAALQSLEPPQNQHGAAEVGRSQPEAGRAA